MIVEAEPDLVIGGLRFASHYEDIKALVPTTIELTPRDGHDHTAELKRQISTLGKIFGKEAEAQALIDELTRRSRRPGRRTTRTTPWSG